MRQRLRALRHGLHLREALGLAEDVRVGHRDHVERAFEVLARRQFLAGVFLQTLVVEVHAVEAVQDAQHARHRVVEACVDRREDDHALLELGKRRADGRVGVAVGDVLKRRADDVLARVDEEAE